MSRVAKRVLLTCGAGDHGRLALGHDLAAKVLTYVGGPLDGVEVQQVSCGAAHTVVLDTDGFVYAAGSNDCGQLGHSPHLPFVPAAEEVLLPEPIDKVAAGGYRTLFLGKSGTVYTCGASAKGVLGAGGLMKGAGSRELLAEPQQVRGLDGIDVADVACGNAHAVALARDGTVYTWGRGGEGQLGRGAATAKRKRGFLRSTRESFSGGGDDPVLPVEALAGEDVAAVAAGWGHSGAVTRSGAAFLWGQNAHGQAVPGAPQVPVFSPTKVAELNSTEQLAMGALHTVALLRGGHVCVWGTGINGSLGTGKSGLASAAAGRAKGPTVLPELPSMMSVASGWRHNAAVAQGGQVWVWGWSGWSEAFDGSGQLSQGEGKEEDCEWPMPVEGKSAAGLPEGMKWRAVAVSCGMQHTAVVAELFSAK
ncbi:unnamed protein product [Pedinophyceae sp. YPF-701]|nr:unnamed protein product [Pedinophyceae sp. YPF-701]